LSRIVFKVSFKNPNLKDTSGKNVSHIEYIATRPGVDKTLTEKDLEKELDSDNETYMKYINERPRSHGLFDKNGVANINKIKKEISTHTGFVWRAIISMKEEDALKNGFENKEKWQELVRSKMPDVAYEMGIKLENLRWCAAVHMEKGHPHVHVMFWEKEPEKIIGVVKESSLNKIRKSLTDEVFENERQELLIEKNMMRDLLRDLALKNVGDVIKDIKEFSKINLVIGNTEKNGLPPKLFEEKKLINDIKELSQMLPGHGRVALKFMPENVKIKTKEIAEFILKQPAFAWVVEKNLKATEELAKMYTGKNEDIERVRNKAYSDLVNRISQVVLKGAVEVTRDSRITIDLSKAQVAVNLIKESEGIIVQSQEQKEICNRLSKYCIKASITDEESINRIFNYLNKEDYVCSYEDVRQIYEEAKRQYKDFKLSNKEMRNCFTVLKAIGIDKDRSIELLKKSSGGINDMRPIKYEEIRVNIEEIKRTLKIDNSKKTIMNLAKTLFVSGVDYEEAKTILNKFSGQIDDGDYKKVLEKAYKQVSENNAFGKLTVISKNDWTDMFKSIGINPPPEYMYSSYELNNSLGFGSVVNQIWKAAWNTLESQSKQTAMQAEYMKKQLLRDGAKSKEAIKEEIKKQKSSSLFRDEELE